MSDKNAIFDNKIDVLKEKSDNINDYGEKRANEKQRQLSIVSRLRLEDGADQDALTRMEQQIRQHYRDDFSENVEKPMQDANNEWTETKREIHESILETKDVKDQLGEAKSISEIGQEAIGEAEGKLDNSIHDYEEQANKLDQIMSNQNSRTSTTRSKISY